MLSQLCVSLIINFVPVFTVFASLKNAFFNGARARENLLLASSLDDLVGRISGFPSGLPRFNYWAGN